jgi:dihydroxyacetone kinase-like protein
MTIDKLKCMLIDVCDMFDEKQDELSALDQIAGDGDHGISMARGMRAAKASIEDVDFANLGALFLTFGDTLVQATGGAIGALFGSIFLEFGSVSKDANEFLSDHFIEGLLGAQEVIMDIGGAKVGDKTFIDALNAVNYSLKTLNRDASFFKVLKEAKHAAKEGMESTIDMVAKRGRSRFTKEKSKGHQDPGATSFYYMIRQFSQTYERLGGHNE